jgi:hypothetical protein
MQRRRSAVAVGWPAWQSTEVRMQNISTLTRRSTACRGSVVERQGMTGRHDKGDGASQPCSSGGTVKNCPSTSSFQWSFKPDAKMLPIDGG